ncbi:MAG: hypothetical protein ACXABY_04390 [Candidatus Thorarchaeota archaeon]|jgi:hypothetical protein
MAGRKPLTKDSILKDPRMRVLIRAYVSGMSVGKISEKTGYSQQQLWRLKNHAAFQEALLEFDKEAFRETDKLLQTAHRRAAAALVLAVNRLGKLTQSKNPHVAFEAFEKLLKIVTRHAEPGALADSGSEGQPSPVNILQVFANNPEARKSAQHLLDAVRNKEGTYEVGEK